MSIYLHHMDFRRLEPLRQPPGGCVAVVVVTVTLVVQCLLRQCHRFSFNQTDWLIRTPAQSHACSVCVVMRSVCVLVLSRLHEQHTEWCECPKNGLSTRLKTAKMYGLNQTGLKMTGSYVWLLNIASCCWVYVTPVIMASDLKFFPCLFDCC